MPNNCVDSVVVAQYGQLNYTWSYMAENGEREKKMTASFVGQPLLDVMDEWMNGFRVKVSFTRLLRGF